VGPKHFQNKARRERWSIHIEAWQRSGVSQAEYCRQHRFDEKTFTRWLKHLAGEEAARKLTEYQAELRREKRREEREKGLKRRQRRRFSVSTAGATVSGVARKHGIVTGLLFRWRVQFGVAQKKRAKLAPVVFADDIAAARVLRDLVQPPEGMMAVDLPDGRRVFATAGSDPDVVRARVEGGEIAPC
jgi:transposase-like protein